MILWYEVLPAILIPVLLLDVVFENEELLVVRKPAGLVCHPTKGDEYSSLVSRVRLYLGEGSVAHLINRLDRETSGLVMFAKDETASRGIKRLFEKRAVTKTYLAIVHGNFSADEMLLDAALGPDDASPVWSKDKVREDGASAQTSFKKLHSFEKNAECFSLVQAKPVTGRKHQIRIHLSHLGFPIVGDKIYGDTEQHYLDMIADRLEAAQWEKLKLPNQALHAEQIAFEWKERSWKFWCPPEEEFLHFLDAEAKEMVLMRERVSS